MNPGQFNEFMGELRAFTRDQGRIIDLLEQIASQTKATTEQQESQEVDRIARHVYNELMAAVSEGEDTPGPKQETTSPVEKTNAKPGKPAVEVVDEVLTPDKAETTTKATKTTDTDGKLTNPAKGTKKGK